MRKPLALPAVLFLLGAFQAWGAQLSWRIPPPSSLAALGRRGVFAESRLAGAFDESSLLHELLSATAMRTAAPLPRQASEHTYLLIPGISWDLVPGYLRPNLDRLIYLGLEARFVETDPLGPAEINEPAIVRVLEGARGPVVALTHSKGGTDLLETLRRRPSLQSRIAAIVTLQTPHWGTPTADWALSHPRLYRAAMGLSRLLAPTRSGAAPPEAWWLKAVEELTQECRVGRALDDSWIDSHVRFFSIATWSRSSGAQGLVRGRLIPELYRYDNDGIIPTSHQVMPGSRFAVLGEVNHQETVYAPSALLSLSGARIAYRGLAADLTEAIVRWIFTLQGSGA